MELRPLMSDAAEAAIKAMNAVERARLDGPTPCTEYDLRELVDHFAYLTGRRAECAARKEPIEGGTGDPPEDQRVTRRPGWIGEYAAQARKTADAWTDPAAWEGKTSLTGTGEMPANFVGGILYVEFLLHGWDVAKSVGAEFELADEPARALYEQIAMIAEQARQYKVLGPEVEVPESASMLDRALGLAGRDPSWGP
ncbi:TIGR03086 family metal-binding protein [Actinomadura sp. HBU206391]|uniref:TIGR03086 family metal-binding protein n=1 Tax=Actinomadura sp. HBU206391 TaxID=2731692 RepID=UPI0016508EFE|nr:TIGR03086 family metal-binding protein [Actinomadura sp. HBU206391]MBC6463141.1 TIGR03086 family protein [Actinomadura sp. HBU206391]